MPYRLSLVLALIGFSLAGCAVAQGPHVRVPDFQHLRSEATESVDITLGSFAFWLARRFMNEDDPDSAAVKSMLVGIRNMHVTHYEFDRDFVYSQTDLDKVRVQLSGPGWTRLVQVRNRPAAEHFDLYIARRNDEIVGLVFVNTAPREFTIVNVTGSLDFERVQALGAHLAARRDFHGRPADEAEAEDAAARL